MKIKLILLLIFHCVLSLKSQNETINWCFGHTTGLTFTTNPPTIITTSITIGEGCSSISDSSGMLLFYTNGINIWNKNHQIMSNGSGLLGNISSTQGALIAKQPGNQNIYYVFTIDKEGGSDGFRYSMVDMNLAAGLGSVTTKNSLIYTPATEKMTGTKHCNGSDIWIITHEWNSNNFKTFLLTASGLNTLQVISSIGTTHTGPLNASIGEMKVSPNGKRLGLCISGLNAVELFDFNSTTGIVSNSVALCNTVIPYGCEFSPDGSKFYAGFIANASTTGNPIIQWDLCAGNNSVVIDASPTVSNTPYGMQSAPDGKIYVSHSSQIIGAIQNPNLIGTASNYTQNAISFSPKYTGNCFPNLITSNFRKKPGLYTYTLNCQNGNFSGISATNTLLSNCSAASYSVSNPTWNFGDALSGSTNTVSGINASHYFTSPGVYTVSLILNTCGADTIRQIITIVDSNPTFSIGGTNTICAGEKTLLNASGNYAYNWNNGATTATVLVMPGLTTNYSATATATNGCKTTNTIQVLVNKCLGFESSEKNEILRIFPNPAQNWLTIETNAKVELTITDMSGVLMLEFLFSEGSNEIELTQLQPGIYMIKAKVGERVMNYKFIRME